MSVAVIGAGLSGLTAAARLQERGIRAVVFDRARGPGGRMSTRRAAPFAFDHGAQYFTVRDPRFAARVAEWRRAGVVAPWLGRVVRLEAGVVAATHESEERYVGVPSMTAIARHLAVSLDVHCGVRIERMKRVSDEWVLIDESGATHAGFESVVCTLPSSQAAALIGSLSTLGARAADVTMQPCVAVLLGLGRSFEVDFDGAFVRGSALSWIARNSSKPDRPKHEAWVLHASPTWSAAHFNEENARVITELVHELESATGLQLPEPAHSDVQRWRYALADPAPEAVLFDASQGLALAGDWCRGSRLEGAYLSGLEAAERLVERRILVDFTSAREMSHWRPVGDVVMGGVSRSRLERAPDGTCIFKGHVSLDHNGGFASVRSDARQYDLSGATSLVLRVKGDGKNYKLRVNTNHGADVRSYLAPFVTTPGVWEEKRLELESFVATWRGRVLDDAPPIDPTAVASFGIMIADGQEGSFRLEVESLWAT